MLKNENSKYAQSLPSGATTVLSQITVTAAEIK